MRGEAEGRWPKRAQQNKSEAEMTLGEETKRRKQEQLSSGLHSPRGFSSVWTQKVNSKMFVANRHSEEGLVKAKTHRLEAGFERHEDTSWPLLLQLFNPLTVT